MTFTLEPATVVDAEELAKLHTAVARHLTAIHGKGPWTSEISEKGVLLALRTMRVLVARQRGKIVATLRLTAKKPWAIDTRYFAPDRKPLYLLAMAVSPDQQRKGIGRRCLKQVEEIAKAWPADAIRLDAYDAAGGAGEFYAKCGYAQVRRATYRNCPLIYFERLL